ncbi:MAG: HEAT repeat domain-containing protein [candidate division WOR-3 bacterium]
MRVALLTTTALALVAFNGCGSEVARARKDLKSPDPQARAEAAQRVGRLRDRQAVPRLIQLLDDSVPVVRFEAALALGRIKDRRALEPLAQAAASEVRDDIAVAEVQSLADLGPPAIELLIGLTRAGKPFVRAMAARGLGRLRAQKGVESLIRLLGDPNGLVRRAAIRSLRSIGDARGLEAIMRKVSDTDQQVESEAFDALSGPGYEEELERVRGLLRRAGE